MKKIYNLVVLFFLLFVVGCGINNTFVPDISGKPDNLPVFEPFKDSSVFYNKIPSDAVVDPNSDIMVQSLIDQNDRQGFLVSVKEWSVPVYFVDAQTTLQTVSFTQDWAPKKKLLNVPIPDYAVPDPQDDSHMVIVDQKNACIYDFWEAKYKNGEWFAGWGNALPFEDDGIYDTGYSVRGSGFELLQGMIWPQELELGEIKHALIFSFDHTKAGGPVSPATESDGETDADWAIPEGALIQLDPSLNLDVLGLNSYEMTIARSLQEYGMYLADDGGGISLYAINPTSVSQNPYEHIWGDKTFVYLDKIPVEKFRVLQLPKQRDVEARVTENRCTEFR